MPKNTRICQPGGRACQLRVPGNLPGGVLGAEIVVVGEQLGLEPCVIGEGGVCGGVCAGGEAGCWVFLEGREDVGAVRWCGDAGGGSESQGKGEDGGEERVEVHVDGWFGGIGGDWGR